MHVLTRNPQQMRHHEWQGKNRKDVYNVVDGIYRCRRITLVYMDTANALEVHGR